MSIEATCDECFYTYKVKEQNAGKKFRCKECDAVVTVPVPGEEEDLLGFEDEFEDPESEPIPVKKRSKSKKKKKPDQSDSFITQRTMILGGVVLILFVGSFVSPALSMLFFAVAGISGFAYALWGGISLIVMAFSEDVVCGLLYLFLPLYSLYYLVSRWPETKKPFVATLIASFLFVLIQIVAAQELGR
jgi:uncharacterized membrane protein